MVDTGTYTATLDRFEDTLGTELAVFVVEHDGEAVSQLDLPTDVVPAEGRQPDAVFDLVVTDDRFELSFRAEETTRRAEETQSRFDRLAQRPPTLDESDSEPNAESDREEPQ
jgi:hypothetical protein